MAITEESKMYEDVIDVNLNDEIPKKRFRIDGDNDKILELDTSDLGIGERLKKIYPKLAKLVADAINVNYDTDNDMPETDINKVADTLSNIDMEMRKLLDELFDANVSEVCYVDKHMYSPYNGKFLYEILIEKLSKLYENNLTEEFNKMEDRMKKHTQKYVKK